MSANLRCFVTLVVCGLCARADDSVQRVRAFVDARLPDMHRQAYSVILSAPPRTKDPAFTIEYVTGRTFYRHFMFRPRAASVTALVSEVRVPHSADVPDWPGHDSGCEVHAATISRDAYDSLQKGVLVLSSLRLQRKKGMAREHPTQDTERSGRYGDVSVHIGGVLRFEHELESGLGRAFVRGGDIDGFVKARLLFEFVRESHSKWSYAPASLAEAEAAAAGLLRSLPHVTGFRRDFRVLALGGLGYEPAAACIRSIRPRSSEVAIALRQIEVLGPCAPGKPPTPEFLDEIASPHPWFANCARSVARRNYGNEYITALRACFDRVVGRAVRVRLLKELKDLAPDDARPARIALRDPCAGVRVEAARILRDAKVLRRVLRGKWLMEKDDFYARKTAITYLSWGLEVPGDEHGTAEAMLHVMLDESDDVRLRASAARGLGDRMCVRAIPALIGIVKSRVPERPLYLYEPKDIGMSEYLSADDVRMGAAYALGVLRARAAVPVFISYLQSERREHEANLRETMGRSLAWIGDKAALAVLEKERDSVGKRRAPTWQYAIELLNAMCARNLDRIWRHSRDSPRPLAAMLSALFTTRELREYLAEQQLSGVWRDIMVRAIQERGDR